MIELFARIYRWMIKCGVYLAPVLLLIIRLSFGWDIYISGHAHLLIVDVMTKRFEGWNVPYPRPSVYISGYTEMIGGLILMAGLGTRLIAIPLIFNFATAIATSGHDNVVKIFKQDFSNIVEDGAFPYLMVSLIMLIFGPGIFSLDGLFKGFAVKFPVAFKRVRAFANRWQTALLGAVCGILIGYPISYWLQTAAVRSNMKTLNNYVLAIFDILKDPKLRIITAEVWIGCVVILAIFGSLLDLFVFRRKAPQPSVQS
jgi:putative oxidoreductase